MNKLFDQSNLNDIKLKNRLIRASVWMEMADQDGHITDDIYKTYQALAEGGVGMIFTGYAYIIESGKANPGMLGIYDDSFINEYKKLTDIVHENNSKIALQIAYGGSQTYAEEVESKEIWGPSAVENRVTGITPKKMTKTDISNLSKAFAAAALRAKKSGFDAVEIHGAHGYLLSQFLTPYYNRRKDEYGGSIENRARIIYEVYQEIRVQVGKDFPVLIKLNFDDFMDQGEGLSFKEAKTVFKRLDQLGVDAFEVSAVNESSGKGLAPAKTKLNSKDKESYFRDPTAEIAEIVKAPVILMGGNRTPELMEEILNHTKIKYFSLGRPLLAEPDLINRWLEDRKYRPKCVSCNKCWETSPNSCIFNRR